MNSTPTKKKCPDPYQVMRQGKLGLLRVPLDDYLPKTKGYTLPSDCMNMDDQALKKAFVNAPICEILRRTGPSFSVSNAVGKSNAITSPSVSTSAPSPLLTGANTAGAGDEQVVTVRIFKIDIVHRKEERKERTWGIVLTSSQLLWFRDTNWCHALKNQIQVQAGDWTSHPWGSYTTIQPAITSFHPDDITNLAEAFAVQSAEVPWRKPHSLEIYFDYDGHRRHYTVQARSHQDMIDWINKINVCSAYRWAGIRKVDVFAQEQQTLFEHIATSSSHSGDTSTGTTESTDLGLLKAVQDYLLALKARIAQVSKVYHDTKATLDAQVAMVRHLRILCPLQKATREIIEASTALLGQRMATAQLEWGQAQLRKRILCSDLQAAQQVGVKQWLVAHWDPIGSSCTVPSTPPSLSQLGSLSNQQRPSTSPTSTSADETACTSLLRRSSCPIDT